MTIDHFEMMHRISVLPFEFEYFGLDWIVSSFGTYGSLLGVGFILGIGFGGLLVHRLYRRSVDECLQTFTLGDLLSSEIRATVWDPFNVGATDAVDTNATNTERVLRALLANKGRIKQGEIAEITGWSDATVSRLLTRMERDGDITRVNVGQTKLVFLGRIRRNEEE